VTGAALVAALALVAASPSHGSARPIVYGYPYARECPGAGVEDAVDRWAMDECNCTSYVAWALAANGQRTDWFVPGAMDAWNWPHVARLAGLAVGRRPRVGAVAVWPKLSPPFGHVAYVTGLDRDDRFEVSEYNYPGATHFVFGRRRGVSPRGAVFIYVPRRR
jgi:surface antigen